MPGEIVRDAAHQMAPVFRHPGNAFPVGAEVVAGQGDAVVFLSNGNVVGVLGPGNHRLDPAVVPFVGPLLSQGGLAAEVWFVMTGPVRGCQAGGPLGDVIDGPTGEMVTPRLMAEATVRITDPSRVVVALVTLGDAAFGGFVGLQILQRVKTELPKEVDAAGGSLMKVLSPQGVQQLMTKCVGPSADGAPVEIVQFGNLNISFSDADRERLRAANAERAAEQRAKAIAGMQAPAAVGTPPLPPTAAAARRGGVAIYAGVGLVVVAVIGFGVWHAMHGEREPAAGHAQEHGKPKKR